MELPLDINNLLSYENIFISLSLLFFLGYIYFLTKQKKKLRKLIDKKVEVFKKIFDISEDSILILSDKNRVLYANRSMINLLNLKENFIDRPLINIPKIKVKKEWEALDMFIDSTSKATEDKIQSFPRSSLSTESKSEDMLINLYISSSFIGDMYKSWWHIVSIHDLSKENERASAVYRHKLTGLPNNSQAFMDLNAHFSKMHLGSKKLALVLINIDNFSQLRAIIGYEQSNIILIKFANYLMQLSNELSFSVYHTCHNNFLISIPDVKSSDEIVVLSERIQAELILFYKMEEIRLYLTASIGISIYAESGSALNLLDNAYKALAQAEKSGYGRIHIFESNISKEKYDELTLYNRIHEAIGRNEFEIYYQPIIDVKHKEIVGAEALIRWIHPKYGFISPEVFIPIMEKTGFIVELGQYVLERVLIQQKRWELFKFKEIEVSINMSLFEIETEGFVENVDKQLKEHEINPRLIKFEITEGAAMKNEKEVHMQLLALKKLGVSIALDDFGTGYTSFTYLKKFPANILKIDKSLVDNIIVNHEDQRIVKGMIDLGHNLGMKIVVEGIENKKMVEIIASYGCDYMQGYYFSKPLPVFEFQKLLRK